MHSSNNYLQNNTHTHQNNSSVVSSESEPISDNKDGKWASKLLRECAKAISDSDSAKIHHLLWMLNELASPYGDCEQKLASYFLQALFCRATESSIRCYNTLTTVAVKIHNFDSARKVILKFQEVSPWTTFGHVASNGAILEALEGVETNKIHIIDISNTLCTQWPAFLEALATRNSDETPRLKLTVVAHVKGSLMEVVGRRMEKFARLMGVPFEFNVISGVDIHLRELITKERLGIEEGEAVAVNCIGALSRVEEEERGDVINMLKFLSPRVVTIAEEEADFCSTRNDFVKSFEECLRFYTLYFDMLEESFPLISNERLMLERKCSRSIIRVLGCGGGSSDDDHEFGNYGEGRERGEQWYGRVKEVFSPVMYSDDVVDDVEALLKRYRAGWSLKVPQRDDENNNNAYSTGIYLTWKEEPVVWASVWKPY
ncbi:hypothetical protein RIF29_32194 [Crotalaria pallida]|uniref:Uncharacterized protein n=1 Tax=Crotalaria pallida TaxID=3830 RepID=A0AAN9HXK2_CROPI